MDLSSGSGGRGTPGGGIWPVRSFSTTFSQTNGFAETGDLETVSRSTSPFWSLELWQPVQFLLRNGGTYPANVCAGCCEKARLAGMNEQTKIDRPRRMRPSLRLCFILAYFSWVTAWICRFR